MILSALVIFVVLAIAYMWGARGFFSALIHMVCTIVAGAVAFAAWETVTDVLMNASNGRFVDWAHGLGLALPFALSLAVLRLATNAALPKNVDLDGISNMVGGGVCGLISGVIATGIFVISLGYLRFESELLGHQPITYSNNGSLVETGGLLLPTDRLTAGFFSVMSTTTLRTNDNLARWRPDVASEGPLLRMNFDDGKSRHVHKPGSFEVLGRYTVEAPGLFNDTFEPNKKRTYTRLGGEMAADGQTTIEGYFIKFKPSANEKSGRVVVGNGQVSLVVENSDGNTMTVLPAAVISEADPETPGIGRWAFDAQKTFIATVGGRNEAPMAFEFPVPKGSRPLALYVKGLRERVDDLKPTSSFTTIAARDAAVKTGRLTPSARVLAMNPAGAVKKKGSLMAPEMVVNDSIPFGLIFQKDDIGGLTTNNERRFVDGEGKFRDQDIKGKESDPALQVRRFFVPDDQVLVQVIVDSRNRDWGFTSDIGTAIDLDKSPVLVGDRGTYAPYGYVYKTAQETWITLRPDAPISRVSDMPVLTRSKPNDRLVLLFRVGKNEKIKYFGVGDKALLDIDPPFETSR